jgi:hypothetical protein
MRARLLAAAAIVVLVAGVFLAAMSHRPSTALADQLCIGLGGSQDGVCVPTPH